MKKIYYKTSKNFDEVISTILCYAHNECSDKEEACYLMEIIQILRMDATLQAYWNSLVNTGAFHDAIGKVVFDDDDMVIVEEEY